MPYYPPSGSGAGSLLAANNLSDLTDANAGRTNLALAFGSPSNRFYAYTDCLAIPLSNAPVGDFQIGYGGTGAIISGQVFVAGTFGIVSLDLGTTTSGRASIADNAAVTHQAMRFGLGQASFQSKAAIHVLSNGTDTYTTRIGFIDSTVGESTDGAFFRYTNGVNSGKWQAVTISNGTETATDTGVTPVADTYQKFKVVVNAAGTSAVFTIDGSVVATNTTNIPTGASRETGYGVMSLKSAGTTATSGLYIDWLEAEYLFTTPR